MKVAIVGDAGRFDDLAGSLAAELPGRGHVLAPARDARLILNFTTIDEPRAHWQRERLDQFGVSVVHLAGLSAAASSDVLGSAYPVLLRTLSNAVVAVDPPAHALVTPEMGVRPFAAPAGGSAASLLDAIVPLAGAVFAIENDVRADLTGPLSEWGPATLALAEGGRRMAALGLLPSVVSFDSFLSPADRRLLKTLFGLQQISYGNLSVREPSGGFWMTGRGVDKGRLEVVGRDVVLVTGCDREKGVIAIRVPPGMSDARVSVDAIEHALLYASLPEVRAILHVHAWIDGVDCTRQSWPCGTVQLAEEVESLVLRQPDPSRAEVGLRNHGLTITGANLPEIFARIEGRLRRDVPAS